MSRNIPLGFLATIGGAGGWLAQIAALTRADGLTVDSSNNIYVVGEETLTTAAGYIAELNSVASPLWQRTLGGAANTTTFSDIVVASSGNVYTVGRTDVSGTNDILIAKYDSSGTLTWQRSLGTTAGTDTANAIGLDSSENVYIAGIIRAASPASVNRPFIAKYDTNGTLTWQRSYTGFQSSGLNAGFNCIAVTTAGVIYAGGYDNTTTNLESFAVAKMDTSGNRVWERKGNLGNTTNEVITGIAVDSSENIFACGYDSGTTEGYLYKLNSAGTSQWGRQISSGSGDATLQKVDVTPTGDVIAIGTTGSSDLLVTRYDTNGNLVWQRTMVSGTSLGGNSVKVVGGNYTYLSAAGNDYVGQMPITGDSLGSVSLGGQSFTYSASTLTAGTVSNMTSFTAATAVGTAVAATPTFGVGTATNTYTLVRF